MAGSVNKVILIGNLGADPEIRRTQDGRPIANLRVATSESWRDKATGERKEKTEWHRVVIFNEGLCRIAEQYLKKGSKVYLEGQLQTRKWQDKDGQDKYSTEVVLQGFNSQLTMGQTEANLWEGNIYNPRNGNIYKSKMSMQGEMLDIKGCVLGGLICGGEAWTRLADNTPGTAPKNNCAVTRQPR